MSWFFINGAPISTGNSSWSSYWTTLIPMPLLAYSTSGTEVSLSITDVFSGEAKLAWYKSTNGVNYTKFSSTTKGVLTTIATGLTAETLYYFKVRAESGGNHSAWSNVVSTPTWTTEYTTLYNAVSGTKPSAKVADGQNYFFWYLHGNNPESSDIYSKISCLIGYGAGMPGSADALLWMNNPARSASLSATAPTYVAGSGFTGGSNKYINTTFNPSTDGGTKFTQNDNTVIYCYDNFRNTAQQYASGYYQTSGSLLYPFYNARIYAVNNTATFGNIVDADGTYHMFSMVRTGAADYKLYKNKTDAGVITAASAALKNLQSYTLAYNNGSAAADFGADTIALEIWASSLTSGEIAVVNDAWSELQRRVRTDSVFADACNGTTISAVNWTTTNSNPNDVQITADDCIRLDVIGKTNIATWAANSVISTTSAQWGVFNFSSTLINGYGAAQTYVKCGLWVDENNSIEFTNEVNGNITYRIRKGAAVVYSVNDVAVDFMQIKIIVDRIHNISAYLWTNDAWVQIGATQNVVLGAKALFIASKGLVQTRAEIRDCYINRIDYTTIHPTFINEGYKEVRDYGAVPDGTTDNATAINNSLVAGDTIIKDGIFAVGSSILIPSGRTLYIKNAKIVLLDNSFDNIIRNKDLSSGNSDINILGLGNAVIDGNAEGNDSVNYSVFGGLLAGTTTYKACTLFIGNVDTFEIDNLINVDRPAYFACLQKASNGVIHDIYFNYYHATQNQDCIQNIWGTHDIEYYNLIGYAGDDFVSIFNSDDTRTLRYNYTNYTVGDVYNINWHDLRLYNTGAHGVIFITGGGNSIHDIDYNDVVIHQCVYFTYFGEPTYRTVAPTKDELTLISMDNVRVIVQSDNHVIHFNDNCSHITITNLDNDTGKTDYILESGDQTDDVTINGVQVS